MKLLTFRKDQFVIGISLGYFDVVTSMRQMELIKLTQYQRYALINILNMQIIFRLYKIDKER